MSVYPKRVCQGETVVIHFKIMNEKKPLYMEYEIEIRSPEGKAVRTFREGCVVSRIREVYYSFDTAQLEIPGKYFLRTRMFLNGRVVTSYSSKMDYFYLDRVEAGDIKRNRDQKGSVDFMLWNRSPEAAPYRLYDAVGEILEEGELLPGEKRRRCEMPERTFLQYGNNRIVKIDPGRRYVKNTRFRWRWTSEGVELLEPDEYRVISLSLPESKLWIYLDGINSTKDICGLLGWEESRVTGLLKEMERAGLIADAEME